MADREERAKSRYKKVDKSMPEPNEVGQVDPKMEEPGPGDAGIDEDPYTMERRSMMERHHMELRDMFRQHRGEGRSVLGRHEKELSGMMSRHMGGASNPTMGDKKGGSEV